VKLSQDEILDAQQALAEHTAATKPSHTDTRTVNDFMAAPGRSTVQLLDVRKARAEAWRACAASATAKPATVELTAQEKHQELLKRRRQTNGVQQLNRMSFNRGTNPHVAFSKS
jgi:hypothetical protein